MSKAQSSWSRLSMIGFTVAALAALAALAAIGVPTFAQEAAKAKGGYVDDWSHHHLVYSNPGTREDAVKNGTLNHWNGLTSSPRFQLQQAKRAMGNIGALPVVDVDNDRSVLNHGRFGNQPGTPGGSFGLHSVTNAIEKDWSQTLGTNAKAQLVVALATPSSSTISGTSVLTVDGRAFDASAPTAAHATGTFAGQPTNAQTATITSGSNTLTLTAGAAGTATITIKNEPNELDTVTIGTVVFCFRTMGAACPTGSNQVARSGITGNDATSLETAINTDAPSVDATVAGSVVTVTNTTAAAISLATNDATNITVSAASIPASAANGCTSATAGTFLNETGTTAVAADLAAAINSCNTSFPAVGVTATSATNVVTVTDTSLGAGNTFTLAEGLNNFTWSAVTAGTNGTASTTAFTYWTGTTYVSASQLATNIAIAVNSNPLAGVTAVANSPASGEITFIDKNAGTAGNAFTASETAFTGATFPNGATFSGGTAAATVQPNAYPAKYGASLTTASCANDYVVYPTGQPGTPNAANIVAYNNIYVGTGGCETTNPTVYWAYNTATNGDWVSTSPVLSEDGTQVAYIQSNGTTASLVVLKWAPGITVNTPSPATSSVTAGSTTVTTTTAGFFTQSMVGATITGTGIPTGTYIVSIGGGTSATMSNSATANGGSEVVTVDATTLTAPATLQAVPAANYLSCTAPCMTILPFANGHDDTYSSPFYDYNTVGGDFLFVGDDSGSLHQFTGVFSGTPTEAVGNWPLSVGSAAITTPVYDTDADVVVVGDMAGALHFVTGSTGIIQGTAPGIGDAIIDAPLVDGNTGQVFVFVNQSGSHSETGYNAVYQYPESYSGSTIGGPGVLPLALSGGTNGLAGHYLYGGSFDNVYYQSTNGTGNLYVVGNTGLTTGATLYQLSISAGALVENGVAAAVTGLTVSATGAYPWPSPLTEFCNGACTVSGGATTAGTDYVFFSVNRGAKGTCATGAGNGCILSYNVSNPASISATPSGEQNYTNVGTNGCWATGGIVIDNAATSTGASQIYFPSLNGTTAGGQNGTTSTACTTGTGTTINGIQASQSNP